MKCMYSEKEAGSCQPPFYYICSMKKFLVIYAILVFATGISSRAQNSRPWTLQQCIEYARQNNLQVKMEEISVEQAEGNLTQSKWDLAPSVNAGVSHNMSWGRSVNLQTLEIIKNNGKFPVGLLKSEVRTWFRVKESLADHGIL